MMVTQSKELEAFRRLLPELLSDGANQGKFALFHSDLCEGIFESFDEALEAGYDRFGLEPFLVKEVVASEKPVFFSRNIDQCH
jgi:hypothetical protein